MPLVCRETNKECTKENPALIVFHPVASVGFAVGGDLIEKIPPKETFADPCRRYSEGLNVHKVDGSRGIFNADGHFQVFNPGKFVYSIMRKTVEAHLPNTLSLIDQVAERRTGES